MTHLILVHPEEGTGSRTFGVHMIETMTGFYDKIYMYPRLLIHHHHTAYILACATIT